MTRIWGFTWEVEKLRRHLPRITGIVILVIQEAVEEDEVMVMENVEVAAVVAVTVLPMKNAITMENRVTTLKTIGLRMLEPI